MIVELNVRVTLPARSHTAALDKLREAVVTLREADDAGDSDVLALLDAIEEALDDAEEGDDQTGEEAVVE